VTIALPMRNARATLGTALASVLRQTYPSWELLVLDDYSTDDSMEVAACVSRTDARIHIAAPQDAQGLAARLNQAIDIARGEFVARMDADDVAYPMRLSRQVEFMVSHPQVDLLGTSMLVFGHSGAPKGIRVAPLSHDAITARPNAGFKLYHPTWLCRTVWLQRHRYDAKARRCEDQDLLLRAYSESTFANLPDPLLGYREDRLPLWRVLESRKNYARIVATHRLRNREVARAAAAVCEHTAKGVIELTASQLRLERVLLRHRARPAESALLSEWRVVWHEVSELARRIGPL
jgi:glycosyltransferase involved in cell wall biosynthesis